MELQKYRLLKWEPEKVLVSTFATQMVDPEEYKLSKQRIRVRDVCRDVLNLVCSLNYNPPTFRK